MLKTLEDQKKYLIANQTTLAGLTPWDILGLDKTETAENIKKRYKKLCLAFHPDKGKNIPAIFQAIQNANTTISNTTQSDTHIIGALSHITNYKPEEIDHCKRFLKALIEIKSIGAGDFYAVSDFHDALFLHNASSTLRRDTNIAANKIAVREFFKLKPEFLNLIICKCLKYAYDSQGKTLDIAQATDVYRALHLVDHLMKEKELFPLININTIFSNQFASIHFLAGLDKNFTQQRYPDFSQVPFLKTIVDNDPRLATQDCNQETPVFYAYRTYLQKKSEDSKRLLLKLISQTPDTTINTPNTHGSTLSHMVFGAETKDADTIDIILSLFKKDADFTIADADGNTPISLYPDIVSDIITKARDQNPIDTETKGLVTHLIGFGANIDILYTDLSHVQNQDFIKELTKDLPSLTEKLVPESRLFASAIKEFFCLNPSKTYGVEPNLPDDMNDMTNIIDIFIAKSGNGMYDRGLLIEKLCNKKDLFSKLRKVPQFSDNTVELSLSTDLYCAVMVDKNNSLALGEFSEGFNRLVGKAKPALNGQTQAIQELCLEIFKKHPILALTTEGINWVITNHAALSANTISEATKTALKQQKVNSLEKLIPIAKISNSQLNFFTVSECYSYLSTILTDTTRSANSKRMAEAEYDKFVEYSKTSLIQFSDSPPNKDSQDLIYNSIERILAIKGASDRGVINASRKNLRDVDKRKFGELFDEILDKKRKILLEEFVRRVRIGQADRDIEK